MQRPRGLTLTRRTAGRSVLTRAAGGLWEELCGSTGAAGNADLEGHARLPCPRPRVADRAAAPAHLHRRTR